MRQILIGVSLAASLTASNAGALAGGGLLHHLHHGCHKGCKRCDDTIVIHCYPQQKHANSRDSVFGQESAPAAPTTLIPYQANYGMGMGMTMPMMPMVMPANFYGYQQPPRLNRLNESASENAKGCACDAAQRQRIDQLEVDFKRLANQVDEVVKSVDRNTLAIETLVDKLVEQGKLELKK